MAADKHDPHSSAAPGAEEPIVEAEEVIETEVVEAELVEAESVDAPAEPLATDPAAQASESLAAAAAAAAAQDAAETHAPAAGAPAADWQMDQGATGAQPQYVVVEAPQAPIRRGNRGIGALLALAGAVIFGGILVGVGWLLEYTAGRTSLAFLQDWHFYLPIIIFAVVFVLLVLLVNRAGWWSYILGSLVVGLAVYFGTAGVDVLVDEWSRAAEPHRISEQLQTPFVILSAIIAREVAVWWGSLIAYRGRRVTARNRAAQEAFDQDLTEFRARYGG